MQHYTVYFIWKLLYVFRVVTITHHQECKQLYLQHLVYRFGVVWVALSLVGGLFVSLFCIRQTDLKSLTAYCSVAHMSIVVGGIMTLNY